MNKADLISLIAKEAEVSKALAAVALDAVTCGIRDSLRKGQPVVLIGFGTFKVGKRNARIGRNPQTGKEIKIPAKKVVKFVAGKALKESVDRR